MPISRFQPIRVECQTCHAVFQSRVWPMIDAAERPEVAEKCRDGSILWHFCPSSHKNEILTPILYHDKSEELLVLAIPPGLSSEQRIDIESALMSYFTNAVRVQLPGSNVPSPLVIPVPLLPVLLARNVDDICVLLENDPHLRGEEVDLLLAKFIDIARERGDIRGEDRLWTSRRVFGQARERYASGHSVLISGGTGISKRNSEFLPGSQIPVSTPVISIGDSELDLRPDFLDKLRRESIEEDPLIKSIGDLVAAKSRSEGMDIVYANPVLLTEGGQKRIEQIIAYVRSLRNEESARAIGDRLEFLRRLLLVGGSEGFRIRPEQIFEELDATSTSRFKQVLDSARTPQDIESMLKADPDLDRAIKSAVQLASPLGKLPRKAKALFDQFIAMASSENKSGRQDLLERILTLVDPRVSPLACATIHVTLARHLMDHGTKPSDQTLECAILHLNKGLALISRSDAPTMWADIHGGLADAYFARISGNNADNIEEAITHIRLALGVYALEGFPDEWAKLTNNLSVAYRNRSKGARVDNLERAIYYASRTFAVYDRESHPDDWSTSHHNLATAYTLRVEGNQTENMDRAISHLESIFEVKTRNNDPTEWASARSDLGRLYLERKHGDRVDNLERAIENFEAALLVWTREKNAEDWATAQNNLGNAYVDRIRGDREKNLERGIHHYALALNVRTLEQYPEKWALVQSNIGNAYLHKVSADRVQNIENAIDHLKLALQIFTREKHSQDWSRTQNNLGAAYLSRVLGDPAENLELAIHHSSEALLVRSKEADPERWSVTVNNLAAAYEERVLGDRADNLSRAAELVQQAVDGMPSESNPVNHIRVLKHLGVLREKLGDWAAARAAYRRAIDVAETMMRNSVSPASQQSNAIELGSIYDLDISLCLQLGASRDALLSAEAARSRALLDQLTAGDAALSPGLSEVLVERERSLREKLRAIDRELVAEGTNDDRGTEVQQTLIRRRNPIVRELDELWQTIGSNGRRGDELRALRQGATPTWRDLQELATHIGKECAIVEFHCLEASVIAFVWRGGWAEPKMIDLHLSHNQLFYKYTLPYYSEVLDRSLHVAAGRVVRNEWLSLGRLLLDPLAEAIGDASLVYFIPHNVLHTLPIHALDFKGAPFISHSAVAYAPSAAILRRTLTSPSSALTYPRNPLVMGYAPRDAEREYLVGEAEEIARIFTTHAEIDAGATRRKFLERAPTADLIHLSCHGKLNLPNALGSGLLLADRPIHAHELMRLSIGAQLVTLSSCESGFSEVNPGDDLVGLVRALLYAGASSLLLTLWSVVARTTKDWMIDFYKRCWRSGRAIKPKAYAVREATLALRSAYPDPYIWAPFILIGNWN